MKVFIIAVVLGSLGGLTIRVAFDDKKTMQKRAKEIAILMGIFIMMVVIIISQQ